MTGNPVRQNLLGHSISREEAVRYFDLDPAKKQSSYWAAVLEHEPSTKL